MDREQQIEITKDLLALFEADQPEFGEESWEADIGRFVDQERFEVEKQKLFLERPQLIALSADVPNPGDFYATDIAGRPILLVRGKDGLVRAFLNACRHRGVKLAEGCGNGSGFTCPYHGWTYNNEGALLSVPSRQAFEPSQLRGLIPLAVAEDVGVIVVHPQPNSQFDFDEFLGPMKGVLEDFDIPAYERVAEYNKPAEINWKHACDGGLEAYHVPFLHANTFGTNGPSQLLHRQFGKHHALIGPDPDILSVKDKPVSEWPKCKWFTSTNTIFPNSVVGSGGPNKILFFQRCEPAKTAGVSNYKFRVYARRDSSAEEKAARPKVVELFMKVALEEDMAVQRSSQIMMEVGAVPSLVFGKREINLTRMHKEYDAAIGHDNEAAIKKTAEAFGMTL